MVHLRGQTEKDEEIKALGKWKNRQAVDKMAIQPGDQFFMIKDKLEKTVAQNAQMKSDLIGQQRILAEQSKAL